MLYNVSYLLYLQSISY